MGYLSTMYGAITKVTGGLWSRMGGQGWTRFRFLLPGSRFDYERDAGDLWMNPVAALAIDWLGNRFPRPLVHVAKIKRDGTYSPLGRHPATDLWARPNPFYSRRTMEKAVGLSLKVDGNAYVYKVRDNGGKVVELWWIPHYRCLPTWPSDGSKYIDGYRVWLDSAVYILPPEDIIHIRDGIDPRNERLGLCALRACIREVCTINEESGYRAAILRNSGVPGLVVTPLDDNLRPTQSDADTIRERMNETLGGDNRGQTAVLGGRYQVTVLGFSPEQLNLIELPTIPTARILSSIGVCSMSLGLPDTNKTYSNLGEANRTSWGTIVATQELIAEALRWDLLPEFGTDPQGFLFDYDYTHITEIQEDLTAIWTRAVNTGWKNGVLTLNETRDLLGQEPDPDGDRYFPGTGGGEPMVRETITSTVAPGTNLQDPDVQDDLDKSIQGGHDDAGNSTSADAKPPAKVGGPPAGEQGDAPTKGKSLVPSTNGSGKKGLPFQRDGRWY